MKKAFVAALVIGAFLVVALPAMSQTTTLTTTQEISTKRMNSCSAKFTKQHLPEDQRATFMSQCLQQKQGQTGPLTPAELVAQRDKKKNCTQEAKVENLTGNARKSFINDCLNK